MAAPNPPPRSAFQVSTVTNYMYCYVCLKSWGLLQLCACFALLCSACLLVICLTAFLTSQKFPADPPLLLLSRLSSFPLLSAKSSFAPFLHPFIHPFIQQSISEISQSK